MKFFQHSLTFSVISFILCLSANAQDSLVLGNIISKSKQISESRPVEKVYMHFDKPYYSVADTIWFKAYVTMEQHLPSIYSKIVYLDILNSKDSLVQTVKLPVKDGFAEGSVPLNPGTYRQGNYHLKGYTLWMLNFDQDYLFHRTIPIGEAIDKELITHFSYRNTQSEKSQVIDATIQFKNSENAVLADKQVTWQVTSNFDEVDKGKGTTDKNGVLKIKIDPKRNGPIADGQLITSLEMSDENKVSSIFSLRPKMTDYDLQFFPEGGELIEGVATRVGVKAINSAGTGADAKGTVVDQTGTSVTTFSTSHLGMGSFFLNAMAGKTYKALVTFTDGSTKTFDLPKTMASGSTLQVTNTDPEAFNVKILSNNNYFSANKDKTLFLVATQGGIIYYAAKTNLNNQLISARIPKEKFPSGIVQVTLFSNNGDPISERLVFNSPTDRLNVSLKTNLPAYKPRQKVQLTVMATDKVGPVEGNFSLSVTDDQKVPVDEDAEVTIFSSLLLTSDLKGYVEKPNYYFNKPDEKKIADLDLLMLTQGYRRFGFKEILTSKYPPVNILPEQDMRISGTLRDRTGMPVKKGALRLSVTGTRYMAETYTNPTGAFVFPNLNFQDSSEVVINAKYSANGSNLMILLDGQASAPASQTITHFDEVTNIDSAMAPYLNNSKRQYSYLRTLKEVVIQGGKVKKPSHADYSALSSLGNINLFTIDGSRFKGCNVFAVCLQTMATGLTFFENNFYVTRDYNAGGRIPVQIFINGSPVDYTSVLSVNSEEVESVEVFPRDELGTINRLYNTNGVMVINTKKTPQGTKISLSELKKMIPDPNVIKFKPKGFAKQREFYSPKYINPANTYNFNDLRTTIYWNPKVITDGKEPIKLEYYNADGNGTYRAVIEGIDKAGHPARFVYHYTVK